jgi:hypothetical protein
MARLAPEQLENLFELANRDSALTPEQIESWFASIDGWIAYAVEHGADATGAAFMRQNTRRMRELILGRAARVDPVPAGADGALFRVMPLAASEALTE